MNWSLKTRIVEKYGSQVDFAQTVKVSETLVSKIVRGRRQLPLDKQLQWARVLNSTPRELFGKEQV